MRDIDWYLNRALEHSGAKSDRKLSQLLGLHFVVVSQYRNRKSLPADETMLSLARIGGTDPQIALLDLSAWRTEGEAKKTYENILQKIGKMAVFAGATAALLALTGHVSYAAGKPLTQSCKLHNICNVYYGK